MQIFKRNLGEFIGLDPEEGTVCPYIVAIKGLDAGSIVAMGSLGLIVRIIT
jgi:hypothetical protein